MNRQFALLAALSSRYFNPIGGGAGAARQLDNGRLGLGFVSHWYGDETPG